MRLATFLRPVPAVFWMVMVPELVIIDWLRRPLSPPTVSIEIMPGERLSKVPWLTKPVPAEFWMVMVPELVRGLKSSMPELVLEVEIVIVPELVIVAEPELRRPLLVEPEFDIVIVPELVRLPTFEDTAVLI